VTDVAQESGLPVRAVAVTGDLAEDPALGEITAPLLELRRHMLPPWLPATANGHGGCISEDERAPGPRPIGVPPRLHAQDP